jgi:hypothetical protein
MPSQNGASEKSPEQPIEKKEETTIKQMVEKYQALAKHYDSVLITQVLNDLAQVRRASILKRGDQT